MKLISFFKELRRRSVYKVATVYAITAWLLAQIISLAASAFHAPQWVLQMVIILLIAGFPIALILAWAFELTPEGFKRTSNLHPSEENSKTNRKSFIIWTVGVLLMAVALLAFDQFYFSESPFWNDEEQVQEASIAVLPFADFSADGDQEYFADGISEELLNSLAQINGLHVAGRTSSFQFKNNNSDIREIGEKLGVNHVLEGSVRKAGNKLRITAQLVKIDDGFHVWSKTYDRPYSAEDIFDIQDEIANEVLEELKIRLIPSEEDKVTKTRPTNNVEAYNFFLKGISKASTLNPSDLKIAENYFEQAIKLDPEFALAYAKKAETLFFQFMFGNAKYDTVINESGKDVDFALLLDDDLAEAYVALGLNHMLQNEQNSSLLAFKKAKKLKPGDAEISAYYGLGLWQNNQPKEAQKELEFAHKLDPLSPLVNLYLGEIYSQNDAYEAAEKHFLSAINIYPNYLIAYESLANLYGAKLGQHDKAIITMHKAYKEAEEKSKTVEFIFYPAVDLGLLGLAENALDILKRDFPNNLATLNTQLYWLARHEKYQQALELIKTSDSITGIMPDHYFLRQIRTPALATKQYNYFLEEVGRRAPEVLKTDTTNFEDRSFSTMLGAIIALKETDQNNKANTLLQNLNNYLESLPKEEVASENGRYYWEYAACKGLQNDREAVKKALKIRINSGNIIGNHLLYGIENELYLHMSPKELAPFKEAEEKSITKQRKNVIAYLKKEGEWQNDWEEQ